MEVLCIQGSAPGHIVATLSHAAQIRQLPMVVASHPAGGWQIALPNGEFGPRCRSVQTAILMEASEAFSESVQVARAA
jgi:topoisomerase IA-like protein